MFNIISDQNISECHLRVYQYLTNAKQHTFLPVLTISHCFDPKSHISQVKIGASPDYSSHVDNSTFVCSYTETLFQKSHQLMPVPLQASRMHEEIRLFCYVCPQPIASTAVIHLKV